jgi:hypothetical protein
MLADEMGTTCACLQSAEVCCCEEGILNVPPLVRRAAQSYILEISALHRRLTALSLTLTRIQHLTRILTPNLALAVREALQSSRLLCACRAIEAERGEERERGSGERLTGQPPTLCFLDCSGLKRFTRSTTHMTALRTKVTFGTESRH